MRSGALVCVAFCAGPLCAQTPPQIKMLVHNAMQRMTDSVAARLDYTFTQRTEKRELADDGSVRNLHTFLTRREVHGDTAVYRQTEKDGRPLAVEDQKAQTFTRDQELKRIRVELGWLLESSDALDFKPAGEQTVNGRSTTVLDFWPHPGYQAKTLRARVFEKAKGRLWIDAQDNELVRAGAEVFDTISIGFGIGKIEKGTQFHVERTKLPSGVWLLDSQTVRFAVRLLLVKQVHEEILNRYSDYRYKAEREVRASSAIKSCSPACGTQSVSSASPNGRRSANEIVSGSR